MAKYKISSELLRALRRYPNITLFGEGQGAVPTHAGGGTMLGAASRTLIDQESMQLHDRALAILAAASQSGMTYAEALELARKEAADKALADARGPQFREARFNGCRRVGVDPCSVKIDARAKAIAKEESISFGEALMRARHEIEDGNE